jgi:hypothetical protein
MRLLGDTKERERYRVAFPSGGVPWSLFEPHREQAQKNHGQALERLAERGGLGPDEMLAIIEGRRWHAMDEADALAQLKALVQPAAPPVSGDGDDAEAMAIAEQFGVSLRTGAVNAIRAGLERGRALGARDCGHDLATIATDAHGMGQENAMSNVMDWLLEEGADDLVRKLETGEWHKVAMNARRSGGQGK